jgi:hypothetical protein
VDLATLLCYKTFIFSLAKGMWVGKQAWHHKDFTKF